MQHDDQFCPLCGRWLMSDLVSSPFPGWACCEPYPTTYPVPQRPLAGA